MQADDVVNLVRQTRGLDPEMALDRDEEWDSLDHLAILGALQDQLGDEFGALDLSEANSIAKLQALLCE